MPAIPPGPLGPEERHQVAAYLAERLARPVGLDLWTRKESGLVRTDRDVCAHCDEVLAMVRQLVTLHPALSVTPYDLDRHAERAAEAEVTLAPTTIVRGGGRSLHVVGLLSGLLFPAFLDLVAYVSSGGSPLEDETRAALAGLEERVEIEAMVSPFDSYSAYMARVVGAFGAASRSVRVRIIEMSQFPVLAGQRSLTEVPALTINGRRFAGVWEEAPLLEQIRRVLAGNDEPVIRDRVLTVRYVTEDEAKQLAREQEQAFEAARGLELGAQPSEAERSEPASGLYIPGRD
jgi:hypothetical protein